MGILKRKKRKQVTDNICVKIRKTVIDETLESIRKMKTYQEIKEHAM